MSAASKNPGSGSGAERRKAERKPVLETFNLFVSIPRKGPYRLRLHDLSDLGVGFDFDTDGESLAEFPLKTGDALEIHLYFNQSLYLPLTVTVARLETKDGVRRVGAEYKEKRSKAHKALISFIGVLDGLSEIGKIEPAPPL
jgi:hypothetical protein